MVEPGAKSSLELNTDIDDSSNIRNGVDKTVENKEIAPLEGGDFANSRQRPSSPAPYAFHTDGSNSTKSGVAKRQMSPSVPSKSILSPSNANSSCLRAPYAQPVLDASKLQSNKRPATSVDDKISSVRERRQQQQQIIDGHVNARREKEKASRAKWEMEQEIRKKKTEETREKDHVRRKEVEDRKNKQLQEEKKRAEAIVARSDEQIKVVLRQKRSSSVDKSKRWSWGAGGYGGGGGVATQATHVKTAPSPFHYFDATRLTKRVPTHGNEGGDANATPTSTSAIGSSSNSSGQDNRFSKSPLVMNTSHMRFASGLRSYDSSPTQTKSPSPASARGPRARSLDSRQRNRTSSNNTPENKRVATRGRSPAPRAAPNLTSKGRISPQLTEPVQMSSRLLAPTKASAARSRHDKDDNVTSHVTVSTPLRSRNSDRTRPSSAKSDVSSASSARSSPRSQSNKKPTGSKPSPGRSPSPLLLKQQPQPRSPVAASASPRLRTAESPRMKASPSTRSRSTQDAKDPPKRRVSPARLSSPTPKNTPALKKTPVKDTTRPTKSTPPVIKQSLRSTAPPARSKVSSPTTQPPSKTVPVKKVKQTEKSVKKTEPKVKGKTPVKSTPQPKSGGKQKMAEGLNKTFTVSPSLQMSSSNEPKAVEESTTTSPPPINSSQVSTEKKVVVVPDVNTVLDRSTSPDLARSSLESTPVLDEASVVVNAPEEQPRVLEEHNVKSTTQEEVNMVSDAAAPEETHPCTEEDNSEEIPMVMATNSLADEMQMALMSENDQPPKAGEPSGPGDLSLDVNEISTPKEEKTSTPSGETSTPSGDLPLDSSLLHQQEETTSTPSADLPLDSSLLHQQEEQIDEKVIITKEISETVITEAKEEGLEEPHLYNGSVHPEKGGTVKDEITPEKIEKAALTEGPGEKQVASLQEDNTASEITQIIEMIKEDQVEDPSTVDIQPSEQHEPLKNTSPPVPNEIASPEDQKKKEKKLTPEEQAYKDAIAAKRREMKEKREKEEKERLERLKLEAEQQAKREEDARMMAEEARMEQLKLEEEERIKKDELEKRRRVEAEEKERKHEEYMREQRERMEQRAREEAERIRKERDIAAQKKEEERSARRKRLEMIMRRTRGGDSPASNPPSGDQSPANLTPTGGRSPYNSVTPDRVVSPVTVDKRGSAEISALQVPDVNKIQQALIKAKEVPPNDHNTSSGIDTIALELDSSDNAHTNGSRPLPPPFVAFEDKFDGEAGNHPQSGDFIDVSPQNNDLGFGDSLAYETASGLQRENGDSPRSAFVPFKENINEVPTGNLLDL